MNLKRLHSFVTVVDQGNLSRAAERLNLSQPALSRRIQELELEIGFELFEREGRVIRLTGQGEEFLKHSRDLVARSTELQNCAERLKGGYAGTLRVGASSPIIDLFFPDILKHFRKTHPNVSVQLVEDGSVDLLHQLERGDLHLAVSSFPADNQFQSETVAVVPVLAGIAHSNGPYEPDPLEVKELADRPLLLLGPNFYTRVTFDAACRIAHIQPQILFESSSPQTLLALAEAELGVAIVPATVRLKSQHRLSLRPIVSAGRALEKRISINWNRSQSRPPYAALFIEAARWCIQVKFAPVLADLQQLSSKHAARSAESITTLLET